jgi:hypothetical protein
MLLFRDKGHRVAATFDLDGDGTGHRRREAELIDCRAKLAALAFAARRAEPIFATEVHALAARLHAVVDPHDGQAHAMMRVFEALGVHAGDDVATRKRFFHACRGLVESHLSTVHDDDA